MLSALLACLSLCIVRIQCLPSSESPQGQAPFLSDSLDPYPSKPRLTFRDDGSFKITVFSDLHFGENPWDDWGPEHDTRSVQLIRMILADEKPDYVVINGDLITGENTFKENATLLIDQIVTPLNEAKVPFSTTQGNHDNEVNITHFSEILREQETAPLSYTRLAPPGVGGDGGPGNYWVPVYARSSDLAPILVLWFFDSRGGFSPGESSTAVPDYVDPSVADWIVKETAQMNAVWGPAENRGALAFVHIPPNIIRKLQPSLNNETNPGLNDDILGDGAVQDSSNTDKDIPFWDAVTQHVNNLHAVISGHAHGNEWCVREPKKDIVFCFNKHSGYGGYDNPTWGHGVRNLVFSSFDTVGDVKTWIRLEEGETRGEIVLNRNYGRN